MDVDLTNCDREPIHELGHVQSFGCLVCVSPDWLVLRASANTADHLGVAASDMIGSPLRDFFSLSALHDIRAEIQSLSSPDAIARRYDVQLFDDRADAFNVAVHRTSENIIIEIEPVLADGRSRESALAQVRGIIERLKQSESVEKLSCDAARFVKALSGFDRVMVYRFAPDGSGEVIAEAKSADADPFLGLRYPASDIPKQARALYMRSPIRIISDIRDKVSPIVPELSATGQPLDLSLSTLRAVSPIHIEYLRNMGVGASMSISIMDGDRLWGLIACHHDTPRRLDHAVRSACDLFAQMFGFLLAQVNSRRSAEETDRARELHNALMRQLAEGGSIIEDFDLIVAELSELIEFDGAIAWIDGEFRQWGKTPAREEVDRLMRFLNTADTSTVFATDCLMSVFPPAEDFVGRAAGLMALPVSRTPRDYVILFRGELARKVTWAGNPEKPVELGPNGARLTPRKSFEAWTTVTSGQSAEWSSAERQVAEAIRVTLLEVVLRLSDEAGAERKRAHEKQELLIAELNHRVRNILNLIKGLVDQGKSETGTVSEFTQVVGDRIHALARAHDQITSETWEAASLRKMIQTEVAAYLGKKQFRMNWHGPDAIVEPEALSALALVFHELTTNSAKYGALSDSRGSIDIRVDRDVGGGMSLSWIESDGPAVKPPMRRGFGSTIIERSIPFELGGKAEVSYPITGVEAKFFVPARHVKKFAEAGADTPTALRVLQAADAQVLEGTALLVEDNLIIALDTEEFLLELGAKEVHACSSVGEALRLIEEHDLSCAVLDLNLGTETSLEVGRELARRSIPFTFATGYGETSELLREFEGVPVVTKPYDRKSLAAALGRAIAAHGADAGA